MVELLIERLLSATEEPSVTQFFVRHEVFALNSNILRSTGGSELSVKKSEQLSLVNSRKECGMCFWNFEQ
jgi:hypothetical protein